MAKELETIIKMGGKLDPSLQASVKAAEGMIEKTASRAEQAARREERIRSDALMKQTQLDQRVQLKAQQMAEKAELKRQQFAREGITQREKLAEQAAQRERHRAESDALKIEQLQEKAAKQRVEIEEDASDKISAIREKEAKKMTGVAEKATEDARKSAEKRIQALEQRLDKFSKVMTRSVTMPLAALGVVGLKKFMEFDDAMRKVQATLGATPADMEKLTDAAKKMGRETKFTAGEAAGALEAIGQAGFDAAMSIEIAPYALKAAQAFGMSIDNAASYLTQSMSTFDIAPQYIERFTDQAAQGAAAFTTDAQSMMDAGLRVGTLAGYLRDGSVELFTMTGILSNSNIEAEQAGTQLRNIISLLAKPGDKGKKVLEKLGVAVEDDSGKLRAMNDIFLEINQGMERLGMTDTERIGSFKELFGDTSFASADALAKYAASGKWDLKSKFIENSKDATKTMAETMEGGIGGAYRSMTSAAEGALIEVGNALSEPAQKLMGYVTGVLNAFSGADESTQKFILTVGGIVGTIGPGTKVLTSLTGLGSRVRGVKSATGKAETGWTNFAGKIGKLGILGKFALGAGAVAAVGFAVKATADAITQAELEERFGDIVLSQDQVQKVADSIKTPFTDALTEINAMFDALDQRVAGMKETGLSLKADLIVLPTSVDKEDVESLAQKYNDYVDSLQSSLSTYEGLHRVEIQTVFGEGDKDGTALETKFNEYYGGLNAKAAEIGGLLKQEFENALLTGQVDKAKVREYQNQLAQIWAEVDAFETRSELYALAEGLNNGSLSYGSTADLFQAIQQSTAASLSGIDERQNRLIGNVRALYSDDPAEADRQAARIRGEMDEERAQLLAIQAEVMNQYLPDTLNSVFAGAEDLEKSLEGINLMEFSEQYSKMMEAEQSRDFKTAVAIQAQIKPDADVIDAAFQAANISTGGWWSDSDAASKLYGDMNAEALLEQMATAIQQYQSANLPVPEAILQAQNTLALIEGIASSGLGLDLMAHNMQMGVGDYSAYLATAEESVSSGMEATASSAEQMDTTVRGVGRSSINAANTVVASALRAEGYVQRFANQVPVMNVTTFAGGGVGTDHVPTYSEGGTVTRATLAWIGEGADDETVVPHNNHSRSRSLLTEAAAGVGMPLGGGAQYVFSPQIIIQGNADKQQVDDALETGFEQFKRWMQELEWERGRTSFG